MLASKKDVLDRTIMKFGIKFNKKLPEGVAKRVVKSQGLAMAKAISSGRPVKVDYIGKFVLLQSTKEKVEAAQAKMTQSETESEIDRNTNIGEGSD